MLIDSHNHVNYCGKNTKAVVADMDAHGIDVTWLLTWHLPVAENSAGYHHHSPLHIRPDGTHPAMPLADVVAACERYPDRFVPGYHPNPWDRDAVTHLEEAVQLHGVRVCGEWSYRMLLDDPRAIEIFRAAGRLRLPVILHIDVPYLPGPNGKPVYQAGWCGGTVDNLERAMQACPETIFVGHAPGFWREISGDADRNPKALPDGPVTPGGKIGRLLETYPTLWADLSANSGLNALRRDPAHARVFILRWSDRLLYARDSYMTELLPFLKSLELPAEAMDKITHRNALRLAPLPGRA